MERARIKDSVWPDPSGKEYRELSWKLRHSQDALTRSDLYCAAEVMEAFSVLVADPAISLEDAQAKLSVIRESIKLNRSRETL